MSAIKRLAFAGGDRPERLVVVAAGDALEIPNDRAPYVAADLLAMYAVIGVNSTAQNLLFVPLGVQEMALAAWMVARGFRPAAPSTGREQPRRPSSRGRSYSVRHVVRG